MNKILIVALTLIATHAYADNTVQFTPPEALPADVTSERVVEVDSELDSNNNDFYEGRFVIEASSRVNGSTSGTLIQSANQSSRDSYTNGVALAVNGRYFVSHEQALTFSIPVYAISKSNTSDYYEGQSLGYNDITIAPVLFGYRYQFSSVGTSNLFRPYFQAEAGLVFAKSYENSVVGLDRPTTTSSSMGFKPSVGIDAYFSKRSPLYVGVQTGYLFVKDFGNSEFAINLGAQL